MSLQFKSNGYQIVNGAISKQTADIMALEFEMLRTIHYTNCGVPLDYIGFCSDNLVKNSFSWYAVPCFESLLEYMKPMVETVTEKKLYPTYSYARIYYNGATMERHIDRESCEYSVTLSISVDSNGPWEIYMKGRDGIETPVRLNVGDMCVYKGNEIEHWREIPYTGNKQIQCFLHFVDAEGEFADYKFDKRFSLGQSGNKK